MTTDPASPPDAPAPMRMCENCRAALQGGYCHLCGQPEHSPVRHVGHAVEEVFESFWHLDGRIFRTLRGLWVPGRVANEYLAGHRVRYVAPMRLFVILTALTFFVAQFLVTDAGPGPQINAGSSANAMAEAVREAETVAEAERVRDGFLATLEEARAELPSYMPGLDASIVSAESTVRRAAEERIRELRTGDVEEPAPPATDGGDAPAQQEDLARDRPGPDPPAAPDAPDAEEPAAPQEAPGTAAETAGTDAAEAVEQPESLERLGRNVERLTADPRGFFRALLGAAPMALFITVPLFAVMLKLAYLFRRRLYLEHVVVALYSHAWLMVVLLLYFFTVLAAGWLAPHAAWTARPMSWLQTLMLWAMPVYLLWMQKRVYGQSWPMTLFKYCVIGTCYMILVFSVALSVSIYVLFTM